MSDYVVEMSIFGANGLLNEGTNAPLFTTDSTWIHPVEREGGAFSSLYKQVEPKIPFNQSD